MANILLRIQEIALKEGITIGAMERTIGASKGGVSRAINNGTDIQSKWLQRIVENFPQYSADWLLSGRGSMLRRQQEETVTIEHKPSIELIPSTDDNTVTIPIVEISVAAGTAGYCNPGYLEIVDGIKLPVSMLHRNAQYYCIRVKGDSMAPTILDSSYVVVRLLNRSEWRDIRDQHVYVVSDREGRAYLKRLKNRFYEHGFITCMSDNPDKVNYGNFNLMEDEINTLLYAEFYISAKMPNIHETYYKQVGELKDDMDVLKEQVKQVMKAIKTLN